MIYKVSFLLTALLLNRVESFHNTIHKPLSSTIQPHRLQQSSQDVTLEAPSEDAFPVESIEDMKEKKRLQVKQSILRTLGSKSMTSDSETNKLYDPILADPETKQPLCITPSRKSNKSSFIVADQTLRNRNGVLVTLQSDGSSNVYKGRTDTYYNLLTPANDQNTEENELNREINELNSNVNNLLLETIRPLLPPPITQSLLDQDYTPMRDVFTSPMVSFAYERGWRNSFAAAGFPGIDKEAELVKDFFRPATIGNPKSVVVDMSCASGLFTRKLVESKEYNRVIGCDYSDSMLKEARRRILADRDITGRVELVQCDVAKIPMQNDVVDALNAGAAMHCWPDVQQGLNEIYRVIKPGGRFFATTFLSRYFSMVNGASDAQRRAFQSFKDTDELKSKLIMAGFEDKNIAIEVLGEACVVMRCEK